VFLTSSTAVHGVKGTLSVSVLPSSTKIARIRLVGGQATIWRLSTMTDETTKTEKGSLEASKSLKPSFSSCYNHVPYKVRVRPRRQHVLARGAAIPGTDPGAFRAGALGGGILPLWLALLNGKTGRSVVSVLESRWISFACSFPLFGAPFHAAAVIRRKQGVVCWLPTTRRSIH
jgi:hypothetical protein